MRRVLIAVLSAVVCSLLGAALYGQDSALRGPSTTGTVPLLIRYDGFLRDASGKAVSGTVNVSFSLYAEQEGGSPLWWETQTVQADAQGRYSVLLGAMQPEGLPLEVFTAGKARWLEVLVVGGATMPRVLLVSVPYAFKAGDADTLGGKPATAYVASDQLKDQVQSEVKDQLANPTIGLRSLEMMVTNPGSTPSALINETSPATFTCTTTGTCVTVTQNGTGGISFRAVSGSSTSTTAVFDNLGGGKILSARTTGFVEKFNVDSGGNVWAGGSILANSFSATSGVAIYGVATAATGGTFGMRGQAVSTSGVGVFGYSTAPTGLTYGILGSAVSTAGTGLSGQATAVTGNTIGIRAVTQSPTSTAAFFDNLGGGKILSGRTTGYVERFSVDGSGNLWAGGTMTGTRLISTIATGTPPLAVTSTTAVPNLNADMLDGLHAANFGTLGANVFVGNQAVTGNVSATGSVSGGSGSFTCSASSTCMTVTQNGTGMGLYAESTPASGTTFGLYAKSSSSSGRGVTGYASATSGLTFGVRGQADSTSGYGLYGSAPAVTGGTYGVLGFVASDQGVGVMGQSTAASGSTVGVRGVISSPAGTAAIFDNLGGGKLISARSGGSYVEKFSVDGSGNLAAAGNVTGTRLISTLGPNVFVGNQTVTGSEAISGAVTVVNSAAVDNATALYAQATDVAHKNTGIQGSADGPDGTGVIGEAYNGTIPVGVWGLSSAGGLAGLFSGNVSVAGNLTKSGGSFKINHPLDPADKYLLHSFVESPDMMDIYNGTVVLDDAGEAMVELPAWFEALNRDFRYQLTPIGAPAPNLYIAEEVQSNRFKIAGGSARLKVSWQVTGVRQDAWANAHRIPVEVDKPAAERGFYLHPELHGAPEEKGLDWARRPDQMLQMKERTGRP